MYAPGESYSDKLVSPTEALSHIRPGENIFTGTGAAEPQLLLLHLSNMPIIEDVTLYHFFSIGSAPYIKKPFESQYRYNSFFITNNIREAVSLGKADYTPASSKYLSRLFMGRQVPIDVALIQTSMPDDSGYVSLGISVDITKAAVQNARLVVAEINPEMPVTRGNSFIHVSEIDYLVENHSPLAEWTYPKPTPQILRVAKNVASLIEDGSNIQFGFGRTPSAVPQFLLDKKNLGIHTEMLTDSVLDLIESGVVTNDNKPIHKGVSITSFCMGSKRLYDAVNDNPCIEFHPSDYVLDPNVLAKNPKMITINSGLEIDLTGQVVADSLGTYLYSGIGGAIDLHRGALRSKGGKAIIALPSTSNDGQHSRIVSRLKKGAGVAITRAEIEYVVTEYGIAYLFGASLRERAQKMIELAHPKFRRELYLRAKEMGYIYPDQIYHDTSKQVLYPLEHQEHFKLRNGQMVRVRPIIPSDEDKIRQFFYTLSEISKFTRYFSPMRSLPHVKAQGEANIDFENDMGIAAFYGPLSSEKIIGTGHFYKLKDHKTAELSLMVSEEFRNQGLARFFLNYLTEKARERNICHFVAEAIKENESAIHLLKDFAKKGPAKNLKVERLDDVILLYWDID